MERNAANKARNRLFQPANSLNYSNKILLYPNPSKGIINFSYDGSKNGIVHIQIQDVIDGVVVNKNYAAISGHNIYHLDLSNLAAGVFYLPG